MSLFLLKLMTTPALLVLISLLQRKFGHKIGGLFTGLPLNVGPVVVFLAIEQGQAYVQHNTGTMFAGMVAVPFYFIAYLSCARRRNWVTSILASLAVYCVIVFALGELALPRGIEFALALIAPLACLFYLGRQKDWGAAAAIGQQTLWLRAAAGAAFLVAVTLLAHILPPRAIGVISILPLFLTIMLVFSHRDYGANVLNHLVLGATAGNYGILAFLAVLAYAPLQWTGLIIFPMSFAAAIVVAVLVNLILGKTRIAAAN